MIISRRQTESHSATIEAVIEATIVLMQSSCIMGEVNYWINPL